MKGLLKFLIGAILGLAMGWGLGYIRVPLVEAGGAYWSGVASGAGLVCLLLGWALIWGKPGILLQRLRRQPRPGLIATIWALLIVVAGGAACGWFLFRQRADFEQLARENGQKYSEHVALVEAQRNSGQVHLMAGLLEEVQAFVREHPGDSLPQPVVERISVLSDGFRPYRYFQGDSLSPTKLSPERGQLLASLAVMGLDSSSFARIKQATDFSLADLSGMALPGADLSGVRLRGACLRGANLAMADLKRADLREAFLWAANLEGANLSDVNLRHANLEWVLMNNAVMLRGNLNGADFGHAKLRNAICRNSTFRFSLGQGAILMGADLSHTDLLATDLSRSNLAECTLDSANTRLVRFHGATLSGSSLIDTRVGQDSWDKILKEWGWEGILPESSRYVVEKDSTKTFEAAYLLRPK